MSKKHKKELNTEIESKEVEEQIVVNDFISISDEDDSSSVDEIDFNETFIIEEPVEVLTPVLLETIEEPIEEIIIPEITNNSISVSEMRNLGRIGRR